MNSALFYPWIDITDHAWLNTSFLYWESIRTIVPESINEPYSSDTARAFQEAGFLMPLRVSSHMDEIEALTDDVLKYLETREGSELLLADQRASAGSHLIHAEKLPFLVRDMVDIHHDKLSYKIKYLLDRYGREGDLDWYRVDDGFALFYMTLLANRLAERIGTSLLTPLPDAERLALAARLDAQVRGVVPWGRVSSGRRSSREYDAHGPRVPMPRSLAAGMIANLAIEKILIAPDTPPNKLLEFRSKHSEELNLFRKKISELAGIIKDDMPLEALRERVETIYGTEVQPAISNVKAALDGRRIKWLSDGLLKTAFLSVGSASVLVAATSLDTPMALLAGAGLSLIISGVTYNVDKQESLRSSPYSYLLSLSHELGYKPRH